MPKPTKTMKGGSRTPIKVMGSQGKSVRIKPSFFRNRPTKTKKFPQ